ALDAARCYSGTGPDGEFLCPLLPGTRRLATPMIKCDSFVIANWTDQGNHPGMPIAPLHLHRSDGEAWIVLEGRLGFQVGDETPEVRAGASRRVRRGPPHAYGNPGSEPARYLRVMTPRINQLIEALHAGDRERFAEIFEEHDSELLG